MAHNTRILKHSSKRRTQKVSTHYASFWRKNQIGRSNRDTQHE